MSTSKSFASLGRACLRQGLVFLSYLVIGSLLLRNHAGGADIAFALFMIVAVLVHGLLLVIRMVVTELKSQRRYSVFDAIIYLLIITLFGLNFNRYLALIGQLTS